MTDTKTEVGRDLDEKIHLGLGRLISGHTFDGDPAFIGEDGFIHKVPRFSTDPAAAMGLLQEVLRRGWTVELLNDEFTISLRKSNILNETFVHECHETLTGVFSLACLAALEADRTEPGGETK